MTSNDLIADMPQAALSVVLKELGGEAA